MTPATTGAARATAGQSAMPRRDLILVLLRTHQQLIEQRVQARQTGAAEDPAIEPGLAATAERLIQLLSRADDT